MEMRKEARWWWVGVFSCALVLACAAAALSCSDDPADKSDGTGDKVECGGGQIVGSTCAEDCTAGTSVGQCSQDCWDKSGQDFCDCVVACCESLGCGPPKFQ